MKFIKGEIKISCPRHPEEYVMKVCKRPSSHPMLICMDCAMEDPDFIKKNKLVIQPIEKYFSEIVERIEEVNTDSTLRRENMPKFVKEFYENYYSKNDHFLDLIA